MSYISLTKSIRGATVIPALAPNAQSQRFESSCDLSCPVWNNRDAYGRQVCAASFNAKTEGCDTPADLINLENSLRPRYAEFITLNTNGISGKSECLGLVDMYSSNVVSNPTCEAAMVLGTAEQVNVGVETQCTAVNAAQVNGSVGIDLDKNIRTAYRGSVAI